MFDVGTPYREMRPLEYMLHDLENVILRVLMVTTNYGRQDYLAIIVIGSYVKILVMENMTVTKEG